MSVVLIYTAFTYMMFFSLLDVVLDVVCHGVGVPPDQRHVQLHDPRLALVGLFNSLNGVGAVFGGSASRTPLTLQMAVMMVSNLLAARFKIWSFNITGDGVASWCGTSKFHKNFWAAWVCYLGAFACVLADRIWVADTPNGQFSAYTLFFVAGCLMAMFYNVQQDKAQIGIDVSQMSFLAYFKQSVSLLRRQLTWLFVFSWLGALMSMIPGVDQSGVLNREVFEYSFAAFLPFGNKYMNLFNIGYLLSFIFAVFLNKIDSSLTMTASNLSAVLSLAAGWLPSIGMQVVGYTPNVPLTTIAIVLSVIGLVPSERYSAVLRAQSASVELGEAEEKQAIVTSIRSHRAALANLNDDDVEAVALLQKKIATSARSLGSGGEEGSSRSVRETDLAHMRDSIRVGAY